MKRRLVSMILVVCMLCAWGEVWAPAASAATVSGSNGTINWELDQQTGVLTVSGTGRIDGEWNVRGYADQIREVVILDGITAIEDYAFAYFYTNLQKVTLPASITTLGDSAFRDCSSLESIVLPESLTSLGAGAFASCSQLKSISIPKGVQLIGVGAFRECGSLETVELHEGLRTIERYAFYLCSSLQNVVFPESLEFIGECAFYDCSSLQSVVLPDNVSKIDGWAFDGCSAMERLVLPKKPADIGYAAFAGCSALKHITFSEGITAIADAMFAECSGLKNITIPETVTDIGELAFSACTGLKEITIPDSVTDMGVGVLSGCSGLERVVLPEGITRIPDQMFYGCGFKSFEIPDTVTSIGNIAFASCNGLESMVIPDTVTDLGASIFEYCFGLKNVVLPAGITRIPDRIFAGCIGLCSYEIPDTVTAIGDGAFAYCGLESFTIPETVTDLGKEIFAHCYKLITVDLPRGITQIPDRMFMDCDAITDIEIPDAVTSIGEEAFRGSAKLERIDLPEGLTQIGHSAFRECGSLKQIRIPQGVTAIQFDTFLDCKSLRKVKLPENLTYISLYAFGNCISLCEINIPESVERIDSGAFSGCTNLQRIRINNAACQIHDEEFTLGLPGTTAVYGEMTENPVRQYADKWGYTYKSLHLIEPPLEDPENYVSGGDGNVEWKLDLRTGVLTVSGTGTVSCGWSEYAHMIRRVVIREGITAIADFTFLSCTNLESVEFPAGLVTIGRYSFQNCHKLKQVVIPEGVREIGEGAFGMVYGIRITVPASVTTIGAYAIPDFGKAIIFGYPGSAAEEYADRYHDIFADVTKECVLDHPFRIRHSVDLQDNILLNYVVKADEIGQYEKLYLDIKWINYRGDQQTGEGSTRLDPVRKGEYIYFSISVPLHKLNDEYTAFLYVVTEDKTYISETDHYSVAQYAYAQLDKAAASPELKTLCADLLRYASAMQTFKGYRPNALADSAMTDAHKAYLTDLSKVSFQNNNRILNDVENPSVTWAGKSLIIDDDLTLRFVVDVAYEGDISELFLMVQYTDSRGIKMTEVSSRAVPYGNTPNRYAFNFYGLTSAGLRTVLSVKVCAGGTQVSPTLQYSADTYGNNKTGTLLKLCQAMIAYSDSLKEYMD